MDQVQSQTIKPGERFRSGYHTTDLAHANPPLRPHGVIEYPVESIGEAWARNPLPGGSKPASTEERLELLDKLLLALGDVATGDETPEQVVTRLIGDAKRLPPPDHEPPVSVVDPVVAQPGFMTGIDAAQVL